MLILGMLWSTALGIGHPSVHTQYELACPWGPKCESDMGHLPNLPNLSYCPIEIKV